MKPLSTLLSLLTLSAAPALAQDLSIHWKVSAQFPQYRERLYEPSRWRTPRMQIAGTADTREALPLPGQRWGHWYGMIAASGQSPYADWIGTWRDIWNESQQAYDPEFLSYVRSDTVYVKLSIPADIKAPNVCTWELEGVRYSDRGCRDAEFAVSTHGTQVTLYDGARLIARSSIRPRRLVVLGLGDSYASGEGNPDVPTEWLPTSVQSDGVDHRSASGLDWLTFEPGTHSRFVRNPARWRDHHCHRSFWNQQTFAAMRLAADDPQREVVFLQFSCSGAEILDGMLVRQANPPGIGVNDKSGCTDARHPRCRIPRSQLAAAVEALCHDGATTPDAALPAATVLIDALDRQIRPHLSGREKWAKLDAYTGRRSLASPYGLDLSACQSMRKPDLVLLSVGGNDAGFANLVAWALMPADSRHWTTHGAFNAVRAFTVICPDADNGRGCPRHRASTYVRQLSDRLALLHRAMEGVGLIPDASPAPGSDLAPDPSRVLLSSYPDPLHMRPDPETGTATLCADKAEAPSPWYALNAHVSKPLRRKGNWDFSLRNSGDGRNNRAAQVLVEEVLPGIRQALREAAQSAGYTYVADTEQAFKGRSWCDEESPFERGRLGLPSDPATAWNASPASWRPYERRIRAIRTANDSYLTQLSQRSGDKNGSMHPSAQGHLLLADPVYAAAVAILDEAP